MVPSNAGESLDGISQIEEEVFNRQTEIGTSWVTNKLHTIAFIQNVVTSEIYQAGSTIE